MNRRIPRPVLCLVVPILWVALVASGFLSLGAYQARPGEPGDPPERWPEGTSIVRDRDRPTLLLFIHPRCPCSGATLDEYESVVERFQGRFAGRMILYQPAQSGREWVPAREIGPASTRISDPGGREASRFGVRTSGHVLLYGAGGDLLFSGGSPLLGAIGGITSGSVN